MHFYAKRSGKRAYLEIAESKRVGGKVRRRVIKALGRLDQPETRDKLGRLLRSGARFAEGMLVLDTAQQGAPIGTEARRIGPALVFGRLWHETGCCGVLEKMAPVQEPRRWEQAIFAATLYRLTKGGGVPSVRWCREHRIVAPERFTHDYLCRAVARLGMSLGQAWQEGAPAFAPNCFKDWVQNWLQRHARADGLAVVLMDLTARHHAEQRTTGGGGANLETAPQEVKGQLPEPDFSSMILALAIDARGEPLGWELWPGNIAKIRSPRPLIKRLAHRFGSGKIFVIANRDRLRRDVADIVFKPRVPHILVIRDRTDPVVHKLAGNLEPAYLPLAPEEDPRARKYRAQNLRGTRGDLRFFLYRDEAAARKDAEAREAAHAPWGSAAAKNEGAGGGEVGNEHSANVIGQKNIAEARLDGVFMISTNSELSRFELWTRYRQLRAVEDAFEMAASLVDLKQVFGNVDEIIRGHLCCSFLALRLRNALETAIEKLGEHVAWPDILADLRAYTETEIKQGDAHWRLRSSLGPAAELAFRAVGLKKPPTLEAVSRSNRS
jgi:hypothetical protein